MAFEGAILGLFLIWSRPVQGARNRTSNLSTCCAGPDYFGITKSVFTKATGLPLVLRPLEFWQLAHHGKKHENPFCALLAENPATLSVCLQAHQDMIDHTGVLPHTVTCPFGLTETAVPIKLGERTDWLSAHWSGAAPYAGEVRHDQGQPPARAMRGSGLPVKFARHGRRIRFFRLRNTMPLCGCFHFLPSNSQALAIN